MLEAAMDITSYYHGETKRSTESSGEIVEYRPVFESGTVYIQIGRNTGMPVGLIDHYSQLYK
jgi:hypothetical protein